MHKEEFLMTKAISRVISLVISLAIVVCAVSISASAAEVTTAYDTELAGILSTDYSPYLTFAGGSESGTLYYYDVISNGGGIGNMGSPEKPNQRYNYVNFSGSKEFDIKSKTGFTATNGFTASFELFTNVPTSGTVSLSFGQLRYEIDYATTTLFLYYGDTELARLETGLEAGTYDFQQFYLCNQWTLQYIDGAFSLIPVSNGLGENNTIIKNTDKTPLSWTLPDGTVTTAVPAPDYVDFGYCYVELYASKGINNRCLFGNVPVGFTSGYNGNFPLFSNVDFTANCGFSTLQNYVDFVMNLTNDLNSFDIEYARELYKAIMTSGSSGMVSAVAPYESYIAAAEAALIEGVTSGYDVSATEGGKIYSNGSLFVNDNVNNPIDLGTAMTFTAVADAGYTFSHWADGANGIVTTDATVSVIMYINTELKAVFTKDTAAADGDITVMFRDYSGNVTASMTVKSGTVITLPALPYVYGYTCTGWVVGGTTYAAGDSVAFINDTVVSAAFAKNDTTYTVTTEGAVIELNSKYTYNTKITVKFNKNLLDTNEKFGGWMNGDLMISYDEEYTFFVGADTELVAVITKSTVASEPISVVTNVALTENGTVASFLTERWLPDDCEFIEAGAIYTNNAAYSSKLKLAGVDGTNVRKTAAKFQTAHGQFRMNLGSKSGGSDFFLVGYVTYRSSNGSIYTAYSPIYSAITTGAAV